MQAPLHALGKERQWRVENQWKPFPPDAGKVFFFVACLKKCFSVISTVQKGVSVMIDSVPMTREGYNKIKAEIDRLENEEMPAVTERSPRHVLRGI